MGDLTTVQPLDAGAEGRQLDATFGPAVAGVSIAVIAMIVEFMTLRGSFAGRKVSNVTLVTDDMIRF